MKYALVLGIALMLLLTACDIELGHESHDHDGDGVEDHAPEDHGESHEEHDSSDEHESKPET